MKRFIPDTQLLIWLADKPELLPRSAAAMMRDASHEVYFSLVSVWETAIKFALRRPDFNMPPRELREGLLKVGFRELPILSEHVLAVAKLPLLHRDPFDRLLIAQAEVEGLTLLTTNKKMAQYGPHIQRF